jgi:CheY-like chemotaxis protein
LRVVLTAASRYASGVRTAFTILVVDNDPAIVEVTMAILSQAGFPAMGTTDPGEALQLIETRPSIKVLLSDVMMGKTTGPELVRRAQRIRDGELRVLFMTGGFDGVRIRQTDLILAKPWTSVELINAIRGLLAEAPRSVAWSGPERRRSAA